MVKMASYSSGDTVLHANPTIRALLDKLHAENTRQEQSYQRLWYQLRFSLYCLWHYNSREAWNQYNDLFCSDQLLSHSRDKCELMYLLARLNGSTSIVECGTSFGVSTIYFALAANRNAAGDRSKGSGVLTIEKDGSKVEAARSIWAQAGDEVTNWIVSKEGDLLEVLGEQDNLPPHVDVVFLDAWTSLALPALQMILPRLREGALVFTDKTAKGKILYQDLLSFVQEPTNGFISMTLPLSEGFEVMVRTKTHTL